MATQRCAHPTGSRIRHFWTTQPAACGIAKSPCGDDCGIPGLAYATLDDCHQCGCPDAVHHPDCIKEYRATQADAGLSFGTNDWVRSLLLNIFNTAARKAPSECGNIPGTQGGHWSESYGEGTYIGTRMYNSVAPTKSFNDALKILNAVVQADAYKLVTYGVAKEVSVTTKYRGGHRVDVDIDVVSSNASNGRVNLQVQHLDNKWVWEAA